jgi:signal transduction histidine kinase
VVQVGPYRYARLAIDADDRRPFHIRVGMSTEPLDEHVRALMRVLIAVGVALSLLTPLAGYWLAGRATRPVAAILATAERLRPTRLGDRLAVSGAGDELDRLSITINRLLDQVAAHVDRQERFVADAAHELRGPLTAIQSSLAAGVGLGSVTQAALTNVSDLVGNIQAKITQLDRASRKIQLSIKAREIEDDKEAMEKFGSSDSGASLGDILGAALKRKAEKEND